MEADLALHSLGQPGHLVLDWCFWK